MTCSQLNWELRKLSAIQAVFLWSELTPAEVTEQISLEARQKTNGSCRGSVSSLLSRLLFWYSP